MLASTKNYNLDSIYTKLRPEERSQIIERTLMNTQQTISDLDLKV